MELLDSVGWVELVGWAELLEEQARPAGWVGLAGLVASLLHKAAFQANSAERAAQAS